jgi:hypothetical protein
MPAKHDISTYLTFEHYGRHFFKPEASTALSNEEQKGQAKRKREANTQPSESYITIFFLIFKKSDITCT